jgi:hypothetical protein
MIDEAMRRAVRERAGTSCEYCRLREAVSGNLPFHIEHVRSRQHRGTDDLENLCWSCSRCNRYKGPNLSAHDPVTDQLVRLFNPRLDDWSEHFRIERSFIVGLTPEGRATVELLQMNDRWRVNLRSVLFGDDEE